MPTKKKRVGFIPRNDVLEIINSLSYKNNLSCSKIISILVEEALNKRGLFNRTKVDKYRNKNNDDISKNFKELEYDSKKYFYANFKNRVINENNLNIKVSKQEPFDNEIFAKFIMFLQFQERMKKSNL